MKSKIKIIGILVFLGFIAALLSIPYIYGLMGSALEEARIELGFSEGLYNGIIIAQATFMYAFAAIIGGLLYKKAGFNLPLLEGSIDKENIRTEVLRWIKTSVVVGIVLALVLILGDFIFYRLGSQLSMFSAELPVWWTGILAGFAAGIGEELLMRFLLMTLLTLLLSKLIRLPLDIAVWSAIVIVALVFGLLHLPATMEVVDLSTLVVFRALLLNGIGGIVFGWLYWKKGLEYAMLTHFCANVVLHGIIPLIV